jgi:hypothetical protein
MFIISELVKCANDSAVKRCENGSRLFLILCLRPGCGPSKTGEAVVPTHCFEPCLGADLTINPSILHAVVNQNCTRNLRD